MEHVSAAPAVSVPDVALLAAVHVDVEVAHHHALALAEKEVKMRRVEETEPLDHHISRFVDLD